MKTNDNYDLDTEKVLKDTYDKVIEMERIDNDTFLKNKDSNIYREAEQIGEHITFEYDINSEKRSQFIEKLRNL